LKVIYKTDILVIGGGGAGLRAAIAACEKAHETGNKVKVLLTVKGKLGSCGTTALAYSDRMAFHATLPTTEPKGEDNWKYHAKDIYEIGGCVSDYDLAEILAKNSADAFFYLDSLGVPFVKESGVPIQFVTDGSIYARACFTGPDTAVQIEKALIRKLGEMKDVEVLEDVMIADLIIVNNRVCGAIGFRRNQNIIILAKAVILATGGAGSIYKSNVFPPRMTGDGYAMALRAGALLVNMEFIQIGLSSPNTKLACSGSIMRSVPRFVNEKGEEFLLNYPLTYNDVFEKGATWPISYEHKTCLIDIAVFKEIARGGKVFLDFTQNPKDFEFEHLREDLKQRYYSEIKNLTNKRSTPYERLCEINPQTVEWFLKREIDLRNQMIEIAPSIQHFQGGVKIREKANTTVEGLYACGECAGGQHGANRPGGNALLDTQVFGKIAGENSFEFALNTSIDEESAVCQANRLFESYKKYIAEDGIDLENAISELNRVMDLYASVVRYQDGLQKALMKIEELKIEKIKPVEYEYLLELKNMLLSAEAVVKSCILRDESRGPHLMFENLSDLWPKPRNEKYNVYHVCRLNKETNQIEVFPMQPVKPTV